MKWRILCYHVVEPIHAKAFESQLQGFRAAGWKFRSLGECLAGKRAGAKNLTISFDDGDRSVCEVAQPVLDDLGIKAIFYITTDYVVRGRTYRASRWRPAVDWEQLGRWLEAGHQIGTHTHRHVDLVKCSPDQCVEELEKPRELIKRELGLRCVNFSYPWGKYDPGVRGVLEKARWGSAATIERGWNRPSSDPFTLKRDLMEPEWTSRRARLLLSVSSVGLVYKGQKRLRGRTTGVGQPGGRR